MIGYAVGNSAGPQYWQKKYQPRNHVPWLILSICWAVSAVILLATRFYLARENARRARETHDSTYDEVYIAETQVDGTVVEKKVDKVRLAVVLVWAGWGLGLITIFHVQAFLDLTDMQNREFRYVL